MSLFSAQLSPSILHSLVDNFFEGKKAMVKERLRMSMDRILDDLYDEMVGQVKELLLPSKDPPQVPEPSHVIAKLPAASKSPLKPKPTLTKVRKVLPSYRGPKQANQPSTVNKPTPIAPVASVSQQQFGQKRTADSDAPINDTTYDVISNNYSELIEVKKIKLNDQLEELAPFAYDDLDNFDVGDVYKDPSEPQYHTLQPAAVDYPSNSSNGNEDVQVKEKTIEPVRFVCDWEGCQKSYTLQSSLCHHRLSHLGDPYSCAKCGKKFSVQSNLTRHLNIHVEDALVYENKVVDKSTFILTNRNIVKEGPGRPSTGGEFTCEVCATSFRHKSNLSRHYLSAAHKRKEQSN